MSIFQELGQAEEWMQDAFCAETDPEAFFPDKGGTTKPAKTICSGCAVQVECLEYALTHDERFGIWGGLSERERRKISSRKCRGCGASLVAPTDQQRFCPDCSTTRTRRAA